MAPGHVAARFIAPTLNTYRPQARIRPLPAGYLNAYGAGGLSGFRGDSGLRQRRPDSHDGELRTTARALLT